jgi:ribosomal protein L29
MKTTELKQKTPSELAKILAEKQNELRAFRMAGAGTGPRNVKLGRTLRHDIARIHTVLKDM